MVFYTLRRSVRETDDESGFYQFEKVSAKRGDFPVCPHCGTRIGVKVWTAPFHAKLKGEIYGDMCRGSGEQFLVSSRFVEAWKDSSLTGLEFSDDEVALRPWRRIQDLVPRYFVASPSHVLTRLDETASGIEVEEVVGCDDCRVAQRKRVERLRIDERTWNGEDVFYPSGLFGILVVTQRFDDFVRANDFRNFPLTHQDEYSENRATG